MEGGRGLNIFFDKSSVPGSICSVLQATNNRGWKTLSSYNSLLSPPALQAPFHLFLILFPSLSSAKRTYELANPFNPFFQRQMNSTARVLVNKALPLSPLQSTMRY